MEDLHNATECVDGSCQMLVNSMQPYGEQRAHEQ